MPQLDHTTKTILLAVVPQSIEMLKNTLEHEFQLIFCTTIVEAEAALTGHIDLIVAGFQFNDCQMFGFQQKLMLHPLLRDIPFIALKSLECSLVTAAQLHSIAAATKALGALDYVDLHALIEDFGAAVAYQQFSNRIRIAMQKKSQATTEVGFSELSDKIYSASRLS